MPMVHYIPLEYDFSDLHTRYKWAKENPKKCEQIARQATEFMKAFQTKETEDRLMKAVMDFYLRFDAAPQAGASNLTQCTLEDTTTLLSSDAPSTPAPIPESTTVVRSDGALLYKFGHTWYYINSPTACPKLMAHPKSMLDPRCRVTYLKTMALGIDVSAWCPTNGLSGASYEPLIGHLPAAVFTKVCHVPTPVCADTVGFTSTASTGTAVGADIGKDLCMPEQNFDPSRTPLVVLATDKINLEMCVTMATALSRGWPVAYHNPAVNITLSPGENVKSIKVSRQHKHSPCSLTLALLLFSFSSCTPPSSSESNPNEVHPSIP